MKIQLCKENLLLIADRIISCIRSWEKLTDEQKKLWEIESKKQMYCVRPLSCFAYEMVKIRMACGGWPMEPFLPKDIVDCEHYPDCFDFESEGTGLKKRCDMKEKMHENIQSRLNQNQTHCETEPNPTEPMGSSAL